MSVRGGGKLDWEFQRILNNFAQSLGLMQQDGDVYDLALYNINS